MIYRSQTPPILQGEPLRREKVSPMSTLPVTLGQRPSHAEASRTILEAARHGTLATLALDPAGYPFGSVANYALTRRGDPLFLLSDLAEHTANMKNDPRCSFLVAEAGEMDPLVKGRVTLLGRVHQVATPDKARTRYLERHPEATLFVDFKDFHFYRLRVETVRYVGGFGRMSWVTEPEYRDAQPDPVATLAAGAVAHMNEDHRDAMILIVRHQAGLEAQDVEMLGLDRYGYDLSAVTGEGTVRVRLPFRTPVATSEEVRKAMVLQVNEARKALG